MRKRIMSSIVSVFMSFIISINMMVPVLAAENTVVERGVSENIIVDGTRKANVNDIQTGNDDIQTGNMVIRNERSGINLTSDMLSGKRQLAQADVAGQLARMEADSDYVNHEVLYEASSKADAEKIAKAYQGEVVSYSEGIAVIKVPEDTVTVIRRAQDINNDFPAVYPNFIYKLYAETYSEDEINAAKDKSAEETEINLPENEENTEENTDDDAVIQEETDETDTTVNEDGETEEADETAAVDGEEETGEDTTGEQNTEEAGSELGSSDAETADYIPDVNQIQTMFENKKVQLSDIEAVQNIRSIQSYSEAELKNLDANGALSYGINDPGAGLQWYLGKINIENAWQVSKGAGVTVAVIDSGISTNHPDLKPNITGKFNTCSFATNGAEDNDGHGSHVSGIIAAAANNGIGIAGVAPGAKIISIKALDYYWGYDEDNRSYILAHGGTSADIARAVNMAVSKKVQVINMSLGGDYGTNSPDTIYKNSIENAVAKGTVVVVAAGNESYDLASEYINVYPAEFNDVICVSASTLADGLAGYSNYGNGIITIGAPGGNYINDVSTLMLSAYKGEYYTYMQGTSMATPVVSGVAALIISANPTYKNNKNIATVQGVTELIEDTAVKTGNYSNAARFGAGLVDAGAALGVMGSQVTAPVLSEGNNATLTSNNAEGTITVNVSSTNSGETYYYTQDGKNPTLLSPKSTDGQLIIDANGKKSVTLKVVASKNGKLSGITTVKYNLITKVNQITLDSKSGIYSVGVGKKLTLVPVFAPSKPTNTGLDWESLDKNVATVDNKGNITAIAEGTVTIKATAKDSDGAIYAEASITVKPLFTALTSNLADKGNKLNLATAECTYKSETETRPVSFDWIISSNEEEQEPGIFTYKTSNAKAAVIDPSTGRITAQGSGTATITATARDGSGKSVKCTVNVIKPAVIKEVTCKEGQTTGTNYTVAQGKTINLTAVLEDNTATEKNMVWTSDNSAVATVSKGKVKGVSTGNTTIRVRSADGVNAEIPITINVSSTTTAFKIGNTASSKVTLNIVQNYDAGTESYVPVYDTCDFGATISSDGGYKTYQYSSSNDKVAKVDNSGVITAVNKGTAKVTAKTLDGSGKTVTCSVTVKKLVSEIYVGTSTTGIAEGKKMQMGCYVFPSDASDKKVKWEVTNSDWFSVDAKGNVTAKKGAAARYPYETTYVKATATDGSGQSYVTSYKIYAYKHPVSKLSFDSAGKVTSQTITITEGEMVPSPDINIWVSLKKGEVADVYDNIGCSSDNDLIAEEIYYNGSYRIVGYIPGKTTINYYSLDGSNKKIKLTVIVKPGKAALNVDLDDN